MNKTLCSLLLAMTAGAASADTITVCLDGGCDHTDIQSALDAAENHDVIDIAAGTYHPSDTITLTTRVIRLRGAVDDQGYPTTIIDAKGQHRVFECHSFTGNASNVLENLVITGGQAVFGGGMYCYENGNPNLDNCVFLQNSASSDGGGLSCYESSPTLNNCRFIENTASSGGGLDCDTADPTLNGCTFEMNFAFDRGGGMYCFNQSKPAINGCVFRQNISVDAGGGIYCSSSSDPDLSDNILCENQPNQIQGEFNNQGENCIAFSCVDDDQNGLPDKCDDTGPDMLLVPSEYPTVFSAIAAAGDGDIIEIAPGIYGHSTPIDPQGKSITIRGSVDADGYPTTTLRASTSNRVLQCLSGEQSDTVFANLIITGGESTNGGGMFCEFSSPTVNNCVFQENSSTYGGGMSCSESNPIINGCVFQFNTAAAGGGMRCYVSSPTLNDCVFQENTSQFDGGGMVCNFLSNANLNNCIFLGNTAADEGGGLRCFNSSPILTNCTLQENLASNEGGGIHSSPGSSPSLRETTLCGNSSEQVYGSYIDLGENCIREMCIDCETPVCPTDFNGDGVTDGEDLGLFFIQWGECIECPADLNGSGQVDGEDLGLFFVGWGPCAP